MAWGGAGPHRTGRRLCEEGTRLGPAVGNEAPRLERAPRGPPALDLGAPLHPGPPLLRNGLGRLASLRVGAAVHARAPIIQLTSIAARPAIRQGFVGDGVLSGGRGGLQTYGPRRTPASARPGAVRRCR